MKIMVRLFLILIVLGTIGGALYALKEQKMAALEAIKQQTPAPAAVAVAAVKRADWRQTLFAVGSLAADQGVEVTAPIAGSVTGILFESGQQVRRLQPLVMMDVGIQEAELAGLRAQLALREVQYERAQRLLAQRQMSQSDYDAARAARDQAGAEVEAKQAYIVRKTVYAPFDGTLGIRQIDLGDFVEPGDPIVLLQMLDPIHVDYAVPEQHLSRVALGQAVEVTVPAYPDERFSGRVTAFDPGIDPATRSLRIRATLANPAQRLRPGMFAQVWTVESQNRSVLALPETSVTYSPYGNTVFVVSAGEAGSVVERRQVQTGEVRAGEIEITSGLNEGEQVVTVGQNKLRNGMQVIVTETATADSRP